MHTAMHGDYVSVWPGQPGWRGKTSGMFHEVLERSHETVVGRLQATGGRKTVIVPEDTRIQHAFESTKHANAKNGDMVVADITVFPAAGPSGQGRNQPCARRSEAEHGCRFRHCFVQSAVHLGAAGSARN